MAGVPVSWYFGKDTASAHLQRVGLKNDQRILGMLAAIQAERGHDLLTRYPLGYVLLTMYGNAYEHRHVIPSTSPVAQNLSIDWKTVTFKRSDSNIVLHIPKLRLEYKSSAALTLYDNSPTTIPRRVGQQLLQVVFSEAKMMVELVADDDLSSTLAFGFSPPPLNWGKVAHHDPPRSPVRELGILQQPLPDVPEPLFYIPGE